MFSDVSFTSDKKNFDNFHFRGRSAQIKRASEGEGFTMYSEDPIPNVRKYACNNFSLVSVINALNTKAWRIKDEYFKYREASPNGMYKMDFWFVGKPLTVTFDDYVPLIYTHRKW